MAGSPQRGGVQVSGLAHVGIRVHDPERSIQFYELLGFRRVAGPLGPESVYILEHDSGVEINLIPNAPAAQEPNILMDVPDKHAGITHIALLTPDLEQAQRAIETAGITLSGGPVRFTPSQRGFFVRDPDRNVIELHERR